MDSQTLSAVLNERPFAFVIDLAALASKREYLKLDKWVSDKLVAHEEEFFNECCKYLKRQFPGLPGKKLIHFITILCSTNNFRIYKINFLYL